MTTVTREVGRLRGLAFVAACLPLVALHEALGRFLDRTLGESDL